MSAQPLLYIDGATEGTTQWRAETLQMVNWGGFQGHHQVAIAPNATLLSGASGTGKSTLLDGYLALMMASDTPFNGASNDATTGRARGSDQRNLLSYLKGKTDTSTDTNTGDQSDQVLRGADSPTWGAVAMTFVDDNNRRYTVLRIYFVPRAATTYSQTSMKLATKDGFLDLRELEPLADTKFDKRALKTRFPELNTYDTYASFATTLHTRLGIGANGDGGKALRLLARIQASRQVKTVDGLYKSMVLEEPSTYPAAENASDHFADLDSSYVAMETEAQKVKILEGIPELHAQYEAAIRNAELIDTFGVHREGDTPFVLWRLRTERQLLDQAVMTNRVSSREADSRFTTARTKESTLGTRIAEIHKAQQANGGDTLTSLQSELDGLDGNRDLALRARIGFDQRVAVLSVVIQTAEEFADAQVTADHFLGTFANREGDLEKERRGIQEKQFPLIQRKNTLKEEFQFLSGREGLVPKHLHHARVMIADAIGVNAEDLPFVAELIDLAPGQENWRKATEVTLASVARIMLVDETHLDRLSRAIDPLRIPTRVNFEGVTLQPHGDYRGDPERISGKVIFRNSPFSRWVQDRVQSPNTDALCVGHPSELGGGGSRVTINGQTRNAKRGAHGEMTGSNIIGFSNKARLVEITAEIDQVEKELNALDVQYTAVGNQMSDLRNRKEAHQFLLYTVWLLIDVDRVDVEIAEKKAELARILAASDILRALQEEEDLLEPKLDQARRNRFQAEADQELFRRAHADLVDSQDAVSDHIDRIDVAQSVTLAPEHTVRLDAEFAAVSATDDLDAFDAGIERLSRGLLAQSEQAREGARRAGESITRAFVAYQASWPDPNLGTQVASYTAYREILDNILSTGLHTRRQEWRRRLALWSGQDLVPLNGAFDTSIEEIEDRLSPVNDILATLPFGAGRDRLKIALRRLHNDTVTAQRHELKVLSAGATKDLTDGQTEALFIRLRAFMNLIRKPETGSKSNALRDNLLDVRKHVVITAVRLDADGTQLSSYSHLADKSGGETQELVAFIVGAALRFQLGDESRTRPRFAPVFLDEGFVKADAEFAGRAVKAWKGLGFQIIIGAPLDKVTALEPYMDLMLSITKNPKTGYSYITPTPSNTGAVE